MADAPLLDIHELCVSRTEEAARPAVEVLKKVCVTVNSGEVHAVVGPADSGKATLAAALLGSPGVQVTEGSIRFRGDDITDWATDVRAKAGLFLGFQDPPEIAGISIASFLGQALSARKGIEIGVSEVRRSLLDWSEKLEIEVGFIDRHLNEGFSPAEKKQNEILQLAILEPEMVILDETGTGQDHEAVDALIKGLTVVRATSPGLATLVIANDPDKPAGQGNPDKPAEQGLLQQLPPDHVHVLIDGRIVTSGGPELAVKREPDGYESVR